MFGICSCGSTKTEKIDGSLVCYYCGQPILEEITNDVSMDRREAEKCLRLGKFEEAAELFDKVIFNKKDDFQAYWGRALAEHRITRVDDDETGRSIPTCNNLGEESFAENKDVKKAIELAPDRKFAEYYREQAMLIERIRVEWLEKARKEPAYDVFISFKDSDKENGIERTSDSVSAQDIYNILVEKGYRVFYSHESLRDKVGEKYEPYIFHALSTAKVMFGSTTIPMEHNFCNGVRCKFKIFGT